MVSKSRRKIRKKVSDTPMPRPRHADGPKINAGISLRQVEIDKLADYAKVANLESTSAVVVLLIEKYLPSLWWDLELDRSKKR